MGALGPWGPKKKKNPPRFGGRSLPKDYILLINGKLVRLQRGFFFLFTPADVRLGVCTLYMYYVNGNVTYVWGGGKRKESYAGDYYTHWSLRKEAEQKESRRYGGKIKEVKKVLRG